MFKLMCLLVASAVIVEGLPSLCSELVEAAKARDWDHFNRLLNPEGGFLKSLGLGSTVENLKPDDNTQVYGHSVSTRREWRNDNGQLTETGEGVEVINNNGEVTRRTFKP